MPRPVHQLVQGFSYGDATSNLALGFQRMIDELGFGPSRIFCPGQTIAPTEGARCLPLEQHPAEPDGALIYHFGNASPATDFFLSRPGRKILVYHNVTPPCYFRAVAPERTSSLERAADDLVRLRPALDRACAVSRYNMETLLSLGYATPVHLPAWFDPQALSLPPEPAVFRRYAEPSVNLLFVGRVAPNKKIESLLRIFHYFRALCPRKAKLFIAGSYAGLEPYYGYLLALCKEMGLRDVNFTGHISQCELNAYYRLAQAFVCTSEHEGFCIPLLEAAWFGIPVLAASIPAVKETLGGSGVLFAPGQERLAAETLAAVIDDGALRAKIVERQTLRLRALGPDSARAALQAVLGSL